ncbi:HTH-type transcriptional regulator DmlR [Aquimixticola soesokkakensis]|uniref:HTH-type transcriptional regulator DmlR n=1 Tax=Aquimixticola soesokkakensis TaxID=1519096 RepID=A0A1Y5T2W9_9RHOB|nr:LysR family transcriptional regulator [Aquimixticola soesokkakensis]SLN51086.1 HTH-type transcriptional regulator DmlR [Aquimixticola soesokkakensis]
MKRDELGDLMAFLVVAEERSFTRAAAKLGTSQSSVSHVLRRLEERLGVRLLTRTTRTVAPTQAGLRLAEALRPAFDGIEDQLARLDALRETPSGLIRITASRHAAQHYLMPAVSRLMADYPNVQVEIAQESRLVDIVKDGFDAGVRLGEQVDKDMIAVRIAPDARMVVGGAPGYFDTHPAPHTPHDLTSHICVNLRLQTLGGLYAWEFERNGRPLNVRVAGQFTSNEPDLLVEAAVQGRGLVCLPDHILAPHFASGALVQVLDDWCPPFPGYHLYYPSRRQTPPAFKLLVEALRYRGS